MLGNRGVIPIQLVRLIALYGATLNYPLLFAPSPRKMNVVSGTCGYWKAYDCLSVE